MSVLPTARIVAEARQHDGSARDEHHRYALARESAGDGLDGDELGLPIVIGVAILGYVGWLTFRRGSRKSS
jgi:hypothetical protein